MQTFTATRLLEVWEHGNQRHGLDRALLLYAAALPGATDEQLAEAPLGVRNSAIMALRQANYGRLLPCWLDCSACGERMEFDLEPDQFPAPQPGPGRSIAATRFEISGHRFRYPSSQHLASLAGLEDPGAATQRLLHECAESADTLPVGQADLASLLVAVEEAIEAGDPWADLALLIECPACGHREDVCFDIGAYLWEEIDQQARRILDDIHALATRYGWSESTILSLSEMRRAEYLARVEA